MAEEKKIRFVRCPKCENLLREQPDFSVYHCGACGALLGAKKKFTVSDGEDFEKLEFSSDRGSGDYLEVKSANEKEIDGYFHNNRKDRVLNQRNYNLFSTNSLLGVQNKQTSIDNEEILRYNDKYRLPLKQPAGPFVGLNDYQMNMNRSKSVNSNRGKVTVRFEESSESLIRSKGVISNWDSEVDCDRMTNSRSRLSGFIYPDDDANGKRFARLEQDRAELLRKLDDLKEQIYRSSSVNHVEMVTDFKQYGEEMEMKKLNSHGDYIGFNREQFVHYDRRMYHRPACGRINSCDTNQHDPLRRTIANRSSLPPRDAKSGSGWPSEYTDTNISMLHPGKAVVTHQNARICHPVASGLPFIVCCSCFEILKLRRKLVPRDKNRLKLKCGACSTVLSLETNSKRLIISILAEKAKGDGTIANASKEVPLRPYGGFCIDEVKCSVNSEDQRQSLSKFETLQHEVAAQSYVSSGDENNNSQDSIVIPSELSCISDLPSKDNTSSYLEENRNENTSQENSAKNVSPETEMEVSLNGFLTSDLSHDSMEASKNKEDQLGTKKGREQFPVDVMRSSLRDFSRSNQHKNEEKPAVFVNGQPIPDHIVKKVEKLAGTIQPGDYWYDSQAGFWGVMGHHCLGIIPPFIKEFDYPMTRNCAAGNTNVFVNGRELNQKDLELLASRGLPTTEDKFYMIEVSGKVFDRVSGIELTSLGKLAPTVEKQKRGFGMKVPRSCVK